MCGIIGITGKAPVALRLVEGLKKLEYRGYDSSGIATLHNKKINRLRAEGKLVNLEKMLRDRPLPGNTGIGHTRWATHGLPTETNAHPHATDNVALVHNGIIENFRHIKQELQKKGIQFTSQTDTEAVVHLIDQYIREGKTPKEAVMSALSHLEGAFALGIIFASHPTLMIAARKGSPLAVGYGEGEMYLGSDAVALSQFTSQVTYLEDGDMAVLEPEGVTFYNEKGKEVHRRIRKTALTSAVADKSGFKHFMHKEIHEQPTVIGETMGVFCNFATGDIKLDPLPFDLLKIKRISLIACGTSYYAGLIARYWIEEYAQLPVDIDIASEYRYRRAVAEPGTLAIFISQSGETADTLAAMRLCKKSGQHCLAIVNVPESTMAQEADAVIYTYAGLEIGVAATKTFTTQLATLGCFTLALASARRTITADERALLIHALAEAPSRMVEMLHHEERIAHIAPLLAKARDIIFMGRGSSHAIALEGALKLKEISYIHAAGYPAGELKHGPIALIDKHVPVVVIAPSDHLFEKTVSNLQEVVARGGKVVLISDAKGCAATGDIAAATIEMPAIHPFAAPILYALPMQLIAYHVAVLKGTDVDQPRNLAKSVTVE